MERFGDYWLLRRLAQGGMSEVFIAHHVNAPPDARPVVLKRLLQELESRADVVDMFLTEADVTGMLRHPNIVEVYESGEVDGRYFIVMELIDGPDLADVQRLAYEHGYGISLPLSIHIVCHALLGLDYVHRAVSPSGRPLGIIHRDISPENLFCTRSGTVKVADFGIAKLGGLEGVTSLSVGVKGKLSFMAPEQIRADTLDGRTDQFAVALILFELATGRRAYALAEGEAELSLVERVRDAKIIKPRKLEPEIPRRVQNVMLKALEKKPSNRFKTCGEFAQELLLAARKEYLFSGPEDLSALIGEVFPEPLRELRPPAAP